MKSTAHLNGHPIHPMLIPYPFALLSSAVAFDIGANDTDRSSWSTTAQHLNAAGLATAVVAALPGVIDYFGTVPPHTKTRRRATTHALLNLSALACFAAMYARRRTGGRLPAAGIALGVIGTGLLSCAGWLGGELVYTDHVGIVDEPTSSVLSPPSSAPVIPPARS